MTIPRKTTYIRAIALINSNAHKPGDIVTLKKDTTCQWLLENERTFATYRSSICWFRDEACYKILEMI